MPAPSASDLDLRRNQNQVLLEHNRQYNVIAKFSDPKMAKRELSKGSSEGVERGSSANPKQPSPTRGDSAASLKNRIPNPKRVSGAAKSMSHNAPEIRLPAKSAAETGTRQYPKSPLASLLKKNQVKANEVNRLLVTVNVLGSAGPLRFLVSCDDPVQKVIETSLKSYAREGRLPVLGQNIKQFELHCANSGCEALDPSEIIGALGTRNFLLCKKHQCKLQQEEDKVTSTSHHHHQKSLWKNWLNTMSFSFGISIH